MLFFSPFSVVRPTQIFGIIKKKKKGNDVVKPFFTWNNSFNLENEHINSIKKNRNKNRNIFLQYIVHFINQNMYSIRLTEPISGNAFDAKRKKKMGMALDCLQSTFALKRLLKSV